MKEHNWNMDSITEQQMLENISKVLANLNLSLEQHKQLQSWCSCIKEKLDLIVFEKKDKG